MPETKNKALDPRVKRSRRYLRDSLVSLIDEKGFDAVTVNDLTKRADLNRATFYLHYHDKFDLLDQSIEEMLEQLVEIFTPSLDEASTTIDMEKPIPSIVMLFEHIADNVAFYKVMLGKKGIPGFTSRLLKVLRESIYQKLSLAQPDEEELLVQRNIMIRYITAAHLGVIMYWLENDMPYTPAYMASQLTRLTLFGSHQSTVSRSSLLV
jgi:AcrR family transcriptional regulator